jgi:2-keto-4-pentenoate hydratase
MTTPDIGALAEALMGARRDGNALDPVAWEAAVPDMESAYAVQVAVADAQGWFADGAPRAWKSGGPSRTQVLTHAPLPPAGVRMSPADYGDMRFFAPLIEIEVALRLARAVSAETATALAAAAERADEAGRAELADRIADELVDAMCVSIEVVDSRWADPARATAPMKLADLQSHGALALGAWVPYERRDWAAQPCSVVIGSAAPVERTGTHPLGSPTWLLPVWLKHATRNGTAVPGGTVVTTGAWAGMLPAMAGDEVMAVFEGIGSATVRL